MTRLNLCILLCALAITICLSLWITGCAEKKPEPWTIEQQCQVFNKWAEWPEHGDC